MSKSFWRFLTAYIVKVHEYTVDLEDRIRVLEKQNEKMAEDMHELNVWKNHLTQLLEDK
jgi:hypothetical protein